MSNVDKTRRKSIYEQQEQRPARPFAPHSGLTVCSLLEPNKAMHAAHVRPAVQFIKSVMSVYI